MKPSRFLLNKEEEKLDPTMNMKEEYVVAPRAILASAIQSPMVKAFLAGSFSGTCSTVLFQPLDLLKTKIQTQQGGQTGMIRMTQNILTAEKIGGLWKGLAPSIVRTVPGVGIYFSAMHAMKTNFCNGKPSSMASVVIGASARCIAGSIMIPATVIKVRCESGMFQYGGIREAFKKIYGKEGIKGLTSGILPTLFRDAPFSGLYLMLYQNLKTGSAWMAPITGDSSLHFLCGISAGCLASIITHPADVIKTKMQLSSTKTTIWSTSVSIYQGSGMGGFMTGLAPRMLRRSLMASLAWTVYEKAMKNIGIK